MKHLMALALATAVIACAPQKSARDYDAAYRYAYPLPPLLFPILQPATSQAALATANDRAKTNFYSKASPMERCLADKGLLDYLSKQLVQHATGPIHEGLATKWAEEFSVADLSKVNAFVTSPIFAKVTAQHMRTPDQKLFTVLKTLHDQGEISSTELRGFLPQALDPAVANFLAQTKDDLPEVAKEHKDDAVQATKASVHDFMRDNPVTVIECGKLQESLPS